MMFLSSTVSLSMGCSNTFTVLLRGSLILRFAALSLLVLAGIASAQPVTPGAVEPQTAPQQLQAPDEDLVTVPSVGNRPQDISSGPSLDVREFWLVADDRDAIDPKLLQSGQARADAFLESMGSRLTIGQLEELVFQLTEFFRDSGLMLAQTILPAQDVENGVVRLQLLVGKLGAVSVENNQKYTSNTIRRRFDSAVGKAVETRHIEGSILRLNDMPGFDSSAVFKPGTSLGETHLTVKVKEEKPLDFFAQLDNYGVESTGELRALFGVTANNITGHIDRLSVNAVQTFSAGNLASASANYEITHPNLVHTLGLRYSKTDYEVQRGFSFAGIEGDSTTGEVYLRSQWLRQRNKNFASKVGVALKQAEVDSKTGFTELEGEDELTVIELALVWDAVDTRFSGLHRATLGYYRGLNSTLGAMDNNGDGESLRQGVNQAFASGEFEKVTASYTRLQSLFSNNSLLLRLNGQYSDDLLSSLEQMSLGGPYTVRAYPVSEYVRDSAVFASLAWVINGAMLPGSPYGDYSWGEVLTLQGFFDYGWGRLNDVGQLPNREIDISGAGFEAELKFPDQNAFFRASIAHPITSVDAANDENFQYWLSIGANF